MICMQRRQPLLASRDGLTEIRAKVKCLSMSLQEMGWALLTGKSRDGSLSLKEVGVHVHNRTEQRWGV